MLFFFFFLNPQFFNFFGVFLHFLTTKHNQQYTNLKIPIKLKYLTIKHSMSPSIPPFSRNLLSLSLSLAEPQSPLAFSFVSHCEALSTNLSLSHSKALSISLSLTLSLT